jgi:hypothetical protein
MVKGVYRARGVSVIRKVMCSVSWEVFDVLVKRLVSWCVLQECCAEVVGSATR